MLEAGDFGRFQIEGWLGEGGMGAVYRAHDTKLDRPIALKVLPSDGDEHNRERLLREAQAAGRLDHPNIVRIYDVAEIDGRPCIAMELVEGESLRDVVERRGCSRDDIVGWLGDIAAAVRTAHDAGIVHRDLKPDNIMIKTGGELKVLDFGIAHLAKISPRSSDVRTLTREGQIIGTPAYIAPEQLSQMQIDGRADQFAWGVMAFELLTGKLPWGDGDLLQTLTAVLQTDPPLANEVDADIEPALAAVIARAMRKDPDERYPNIVAAARALAAAARGETQALTLPDAQMKPPQPLPSPARSSWLLVGSAALLLAVVIGWWFLLKPRTPTDGASSRSASPSAVRAITDLPLPSTDSPEALAAYRRALSAYRSGDRSVEAFQEAVRLDPTLAAAQMRLALRSYMWDPDRARVAAAAATRFRDQLSERDRHYLAIVRPLVLSQPRDEETWLAAANAAVAAYPEDAELSFLLGWALGANNQKTKARQSFLRATKLDPKFAWAWQFLAESTAHRGAVAEALGYVNSCLKNIPAADTCRLIRVLIDSAAGRCEQVLSDVDKMLMADPDEATIIVRRSYVLAALGKPVEASETMVERLARATRGSVHAPRHRARLYAYFGRFDDALRALDDWEAAIADSSFEVRHAEPTDLRVRIHLERGESERAREIADGYFRRRGAWMADSRRNDYGIAEDVRPLLWEVQSRAGVTGAMQQRADWKAEHATSPRNARFAWLHADAAFARDPQSAKRARDSMPSEGPPSYGPLSPIAAIHGGYLLRNGELDEAIAQLQGATAECRRFKWPMQQVQALADLGEAYERTDDRRRACAPYRELLALWDATDSVTAARVAERVQALSCEEPATRLDNTSPAR